MKKFNMVTTSLTLVVATMLVAGTLLFPYNYAMAAGKNKNHNASHSNTANAMTINENGLPAHPHPHPHPPHPPHTAVNTTRSNIKNPGISTSDPIPGVDVKLGHNPGPRH